jgi:biotin synthase
MEVQKVLEEAARAKAIGSTRFCMGAAWKHPSAKDMPYVLQMVKGVKAMGLETCMTLGRLDQDQTEALAQAGLDYYNHNLDTSPEFYGSIITTRTYSERLQTLAYVRDSGMKICSGGILGMGESLEDRANLGLGASGLFKDLLYLHQLFFFQASVVVARLRTIFAIFWAGGIALPAAFAKA